MILNISTFLILFAAIFATLATPLTAEPRESEGTVRVVANPYAEWADIRIDGDSAKALYEVLSARARATDISPSLRKIPGRSIACYKNGDSTTSYDEWIYWCEAKMRDFGVLLP